MIRYDTVPIHAQKTDEGFIRDKPVIGRTGVLVYRNADGSERREYRPPEEAFDEDSLASLKGKPITIGHQGMVTSQNAESIRPIGTVLSAGRADGDTITADVVLYSLPTSARELSCGYNLDLDETPGTTPAGEPYDAVQRHIRYNHVAVVPKGRAGIARLNMDVDQEPEAETNEGSTKMEKIRLDNGLEYEAAPEVAVHVAKLEQDKAAQKAELDKLQAKYDAALDDNKKLKEEAAKGREEAKKHFDEAVAARVMMLKKADAFKIEKADLLDDMAIKKAIIKKVRGDSFDLEGKSEDYINAAYDMVKDEAQEAHEDGAGMPQQRKTVMQPPKQNEDGEDELTPEEALKKLRADEAALYMKEVK